MKFDVLKSHSTLVVDSRFAVLLVYVEFYVVIDMKVG